MKTPALFAFALLLSLAAFAQNNQNNFNGGSSSGTLISGLTSPFLPKSNGAGNNLINSNFSDDGATGKYTGGIFSVGTGDPACGTATGCIALTEGAGEGTPQIGHAYIRADNSLFGHSLVGSSNGDGPFMVARATNVGTAGQAFLSNANGTGTFADPAISVNTMLLFQAQSATGTFTTSAVTDPLRSGTGTLTVSSTGITGGTGLTCTITLFFNQGSSNATDAVAFATISYSVLNGANYQKFGVSSTQQGDNVIASYTCGGGYPSGGTLTGTFNPGMPVGSSATPLQTVLMDNNANSGLSIKNANTAATTADTGAVIQINPIQPALALPLNTTGAASSVSGHAASACNILSAASTNATNCKNAAGNFYGYEVYNTTTTVYYLRLYNLAAAPTCSSATGFIRSIPLVPGASAGLVGGAISNQVYPVNYSAGIGYCITAGSASTDNTNAAVGVFGEIRYK